MDERTRYSKKNIARSMIWRFGERILAQLVTFGVSVVLARKLDPIAFGNVAWLMIFIDIANVFVVHGFASALVQKKNADEVDFSTVFYFSLFVSFVFYFVAFFSAPLMIPLGDEQLPTLFRVLALRIPLAGMNSVQHAYVEKHMLFRKFFFSTLIGTIASAIVGIFLAYQGYGAWAIVAQYLTNSTLDTIILSLTIGWHPRRVFQFSRLKELIGFGWKMLCSQLVHVLYTRLSAFFIGTVYSTEDIAYYEQGNKIPGIVETNIDTTINSVLFPAMAESQEDNEKLKNMIRRSIQVSGFFIWPMMLGMASISDQLISFVYSSKWLPATIFMVLACVRLGLEPIQTANLQAVKAVGRSDLYFKMEVIKKAFGLIVILLSVRISVLAIAIAVVSQAVFSAVVNGFFNFRIFHYSLREQLTDVLRNLSTALVMCGAVLASRIILPNSAVFMFVEVLIGIFAYVLFSALFCRDQMNYVISTVKQVIGKER